MKMRLSLLFFVSFVFILSAQNEKQYYNHSKFKQLHEEWPAPNTYHTAAGAPGEEYWQNKADYKISVSLNDENQSVTGSETVTYHNNSPHHLEYLWLQLDQNIREKESAGRLSNNSRLGDDNVSEYLLRDVFYDFDGGFKLSSVKTASGGQQSHSIVGTMMRLNLDKPLAPGETYEFSIDWSYNINDRFKDGGRSGYEYFEKDDNYLYTIAQFYPRMCVYNEVDGWQNKQFLGRGEFTVPFGNYEVSITVPSDHLVAATGTLQNASDVMSPEKINLLEESRQSYKDPVIIYSQSEAEQREKSKAKDTKTWTFKAQEVRDFAFATSRKFIWDAMAVKLPSGKTTMAMSMYPKEGNPLWEQYSTKVVAHTLNWYSHYSVDYPYPVAWSINADRIGMEYPMICFNYGRCEEDGTYSKRIKYGMISVIIHEVGHNFFPMIVNSDERQWTWMDEGLNTFTQFLTEQHFERDYPSRRGPAQKMVPYMKGDRDGIMPIMTNSESILQFGNNAYGKPATALNILRETVLGRELFDYAFKTYSTRWAFKHPTPYDFFRTMEDASGVDLDWFWRGWFYTTESCDISLESMKQVKLGASDQQTVMKELDEKNTYDQKNISSIRNRTEIKQTYAEQDPSLQDFYSKHNQTELDMLAYKPSNSNDPLYSQNTNLYQLDFVNKGGLVMPIILEFTFTDGSKELVRLPAEIWKTNNDKASKVFGFHKEVKEIVLDPYLETADTDVSNNYLPRREEESRFEIYKRKSSPVPNEMQMYKKNN